MKHLLISIVFLSLALACQEVEIDNTFDKDSSSRLKEQLNLYTKVLTDSEYGWLMRYQPDSTTGYFNIHLNFKPDHTVDIVSDFNHGQFDLPSNFRISYSQNPELIFESFTLFHAMVDALTQLKAEFQFNISDLSPNKDTLNLSSKTDVSSNVSKSQLIRANSTTKQAILERRGSVERTDTLLTDKEKIFTQFEIDDPVTNRRFSANARIDFNARVLRLTYPSNEAVYKYTDANKNTFELNSEEFKKFIDNRPNQKAEILAKTDTINKQDPITTIIPITTKKDSIVLIKPFTIPNTNYIIRKFGYNAVQKRYESTDLSYVNDKITTRLYTSSTTNYAYFPLSNAFGDPTLLGGSNYYAYFAKSGADSLRHLSLTSPTFAFLENNGAFDRFDIIFGQSVPVPNLKTKETTYQISNYIVFSKKNATNGQAVYVFFDVKRINNRTFHFVDRGLIAGDPTPYTNLLQILFNSKGFYVEATNESNIQGSPSFSLTSASNAAFRFSVFAIGR